MTTKTTSLLSHFDAITDATEAEIAGEISRVDKVIELMKLNLDKSAGYRSVWIREQYRRFLFEILIGKREQR